METLTTNDATEQLDSAPTQISYSLPASFNWWKFFVTDFWGRNYFNFKGRASRKEYWAGIVLGYIYSILLFLVISLIGIIFWGENANQPQEFNILVTINDFISFFLVSIPTISLMVRRLHDFNLRGWWLLLCIPALFAPFFRGDRANNRFDSNIYDEYEDPEVEKVNFANRSVWQIICSIFTENFCTINGRASRKEFNTAWMLLVLLPYLMAYIFPNTAFVWLMIFILIFIYPAISIAIRRLHDLNMSGWWLLLGVSILALPFIKGTEEDNDYGQNIYVN